MGKGEGARAETEEDDVCVCQKEDRDGATVKVGEGEAGGVENLKRAGAVMQPPWSSSFTMDHFTASSFRQVACSKESSRQVMSLAQCCASNWTGLSNSAFTK
jgi:hypothetical protein